jgi:hypothetical protein
VYFDAAFCESSITECLSLPSPFMTFLHSAWISEFLNAFTPAFIVTGVPFGIIYVLIMRAIKVDFKTVEDWFEAMRIRLQRGPVPIVDMAQPVMLGAIYAIYGRSTLRRLITSFFVGMFFTSTVFYVVYQTCKHAPATMREEKAQLERDVDPKLYSYVTDPHLRPEYDKSRHQRLVLLGTDNNYLEYDYTGGIYDDLRERVDDFKPHLVQRLFTSPARVELTPLFLLEGTYINPGFQRLDSFFLFLFNVLLDFSSVTIVIASLRYLGRNLSFRRAIAAFTYALIGTLVCAVAAFLSYRLFFSGDTGFFMQMLVIFPLSLSFAIFGLIVCISAIVAIFTRDSGVNLFEALFYGVPPAVLGYMGLRYIFAFWHPISLGFVAWRDIISLPYVLAVTTFIPATLMLAAFSLMIITKLVVEPARVLPEAYLTFVKDVAGSTQAYGIILLIATIAGVIAGLFSQ